MKTSILITGVAALLTTVGASAALDDTQATELMKKAGCAACHTADKKLIGPAYKDVAAKRKAEADVQAMLEKAVRDGSKGNYGPIPMPPNPVAKIGDAELHDLVQWVLTK